MKTLGIIAEYNPFHKGHAYMIEEAKKKSGAERVIVVMSGSFVQRGEPAMFDKWTRTQAALQNGADLCAACRRAASWIFSASARKMPSCPHCRRRRG